MNGVSQGSILGPLLFNIVISGLYEECQLNGNGDDTKLVVNTLKEREKIQKVLSKLEQWATLNSMKYNRRKCEALHPGRKK